MFHGDDRERQLAMYKAESVLMDVRRAAAAKEKFDGKIGLDDAITETILPSLVFIQTRNGIRGMGFFQHQEWLVSNAHVLSCKELLDEAEFSDFRGTLLPLSVTKSYHRPSERDTAPDLVVINGNVSGVFEIRGLSTEFTDDVGLIETYHFYLDNSASGDSIKFIQQMSKPGVYPVIYQCLDGTSPQPGDSGSPIFEARVIVGREPKWQIRVADVLYARCSPEWFNSRADLKIANASLEQKLVCAIPAAPDLKMLYPMLVDVGRAGRADQMAVASASLGDALGRKDAGRYATMSAAATASAEQRFFEFEAGITYLNIELPEGLEKLWGSGIVKLERSLMIGAVLRSEITKASYPGLPNISLDELKANYVAFMEDIASKDDMVLYESDNFIKFGYLRLDVHFIDGKRNWKLDIQDNTGKGLKHDGKSLSSVFATVIVPTIQPKILFGRELADLFKKSQNTQKAQDSSSLSTESHWEVLCSAIQAGNAAKVSELCQAVPTIICRTDSEGNTPLHIFLSTRGNKGVLTALLDACIAQDENLVNMRNLAGRTPLDELLYKGRGEFERDFRNYDAATSAELPSPSARDLWTGGGTVDGAGAASSLDVP